MWFRNSENRAHFSEDSELHFYGIVIGFQFHTRTDMITAVQPLISVAHNKQITLAALQKNNLNPSKNTEQQ